MAERTGNELQRLLLIAIAGPQSLIPTRVFVCNWQYVYAARDNKEAAELRVYIEIAFSEVALCCKHASVHII